ncbi:two-component system, OmpR family, phosphate regulon sensor histidine kinase PhoR [Capnocytophaga haemolytica]|uniref:histidine kinase n=1 Tax=Capnocytophaga haemolytica TaxID=45243 RepID=A0ABN4KBP4_9FLAO|nr:HAMP domain-containing sensor histidine kinase [Capnocytophaga haemolytica]AMD84705.1 histidine kinase [Capnocytophaga haemolytica]SFO20560.1 two-component system, OmpR family, phosphate regulon sensor histidine kinase PhoR [Capnocytophaga haemolytica]
MSRRLYILIIILMSLSLVGIIAIQGYWIKSAVDDREEAFTYSVQQVLSNIARQVEQNEIDRYVAKIITLRRQDSTFTMKREKERSYSDGDNPQKGAVAYEHGVLEEDYALPMSRSAPMQTGLMHLTDSVAIKEYITPEKRRNFTTGKDLEKPSIATMRAYEELGRMPDIERLMIEESFKGIIQRQSIRERVLTKELEQLIDKKLKKRGLDLRFEFAIYNRNILSGVHSKYFDAKGVKEYRTLLFANNSMGNSVYELALVFPQREHYILSSVIGIASLSMVFMLIIVGVFVVTILQLVNQRRISEIKTDFINNMTHEFKTPIATMNLVTDAIKNPVTLHNPDKILDYVKLLKDEIKRMHSQVENILQVSRLEKGELNIEKEPLDAHDLLVRAISHLQVMLEERKGVIRTHFLAENSDVSANESHLTNVFINVIENAIKYSPKPPIIDVYTENVKNKILIRIKDRGQGMSRQAMKQIFTKFYREHTGDLHNVKGHGLGLAYVKSIVQYHQGTISVESEKGKGSTFFIKLPVI